MKILVTNDDGINAEGIKIVAGILSKTHEVYVAAPKVNNSGASNRIKVCTPLELTVYEEYVPGVKKAVSLDGSPSDCVFFGREYFDVKFDCVISGINNGPNVGTDVVYSGTAGAARTASLCGIPGIALSIDTSSRSENDDSECMYFDSLAEFVLKNLEILIKACGLPEKYEFHSLYKKFVNVNAPCRPVYSGAQLAVPCVRRYFDKCIISEKDGKTYSTLIGEKICTYGDENNDAAVTGKGSVAVTVIKSEICEDNPLALTFSL